jgi:hypothetical protein
MPTSQVRVRHVFVLTADRRTDLVGSPLLYVYPTISMTRCKYQKERTHIFHVGRQIPERLFLGYSVLEDSWAVRLTA